MHYIRLLLYKHDAGKQKAPVAHGILYVSGNEATVRDMYSPFQHN